MTRRLTPALGLLGVLGGFGFLLLEGGLWGGTYISDIRLALVLIGGLASVVWLIAAMIDHEWLPSSSLAGAFAASLLALAISGALAWLPRLAMEYMAYGVLLTALYLMLVRIWTRPLLSHGLGVLVVVLTTLVGVLYLATIFSHWVTYWRELGRFAIPPLRPGYEGLWLGNPNALASLLFLLFLTAAVTVGLSSLSRRLVVLALGVLVAVDVFLTGSRGAWLGLGLAAVVAAGVWLASPGRRTRLVALARTQRVRVAAISATVLGAALSVVLAPALVSRLGEHGGETRTAFWLASIRMFEDRPLSGVGPGAWVPARQYHTYAGEADYYIPHAHNVPIQVAAELGIVGLVAGAIVTLMLLRLVAHGMRSEVSTTRAYGWAALVGLTYMFGQALVDAYIHQPAVLLVLALPVSLLDHAVTREAAAPVAGRQLRARRLLAALMLAAVAVATAAAALVEPAAKAQELAVAAADAGDWAIAQAEAQAAVDADPNLAPYQLMLGMSAARSGDLETARVALERASLLDDYPQAWLALAAVEARLGNAEAQHAAVIRALRLGAQQPEVAIAGAAMLGDLGDRAGASQALAVAFQSAPSLASDPYWRNDVWRDAAAEAAIRAQGRLGATWKGLMLALERDDLEGADAIAARLDDADIWHLAVRAWGGDLAPLIDLRTIAVARPLDVALLATCRRVADHGRVRTGNEAWSCDEARSTEFYPVLRVGKPVEGQVMPEPHAYPQAFFGYRRFGPGELYLPWIVQLQSSIP